MSQNIADAQSSAERGLEGAPQSPKGWRWEGIVTWTKADYCVTSGEKSWMKIKRHTGKH